MAGDGCGLYFAVAFRSVSEVGRRFFLARFAMSSAILNQLNSTGFLYKCLDVQVFSVCVLLFTKTGCYAPWYKLVIQLSVGLYGTSTSLYNLYI